MHSKKNFTTWDSLPDTLTAKHIAEFLVISRRRVYELFQIHVDYGGIPNFSIGASKRVDKEDFREWIDKLKKKVLLNNRNKSKGEETFITIDSLLFFNTHETT